MKARPAGVFRFTRPLADDDAHTISVTDIVGERPGPRLAVMAGMHVNEVSGIEAARRLERIEPSRLSGTLSVVSLLNEAAWPSRSVGVCPLDDRNVNFCFPGDPGGSCSERVADAVLTDWAADAVCLVDLHGADLCEDIIRYSICQMTGDADFDSQALELARAFDVQVVVALGEEYLDKPGRSVTGRATRMQFGAFAEAGRGGLLGEDDVRMHYEGVLRVARHFGVVVADQDSPVASVRRVEPTLLNNYAWIPTPVTGWCEMQVAAGDQVSEGGVLATITPREGKQALAIVSPASGVVLWCDTHPAITAGSHIAGIGY